MKALVNDNTILCYNAHEGKTTIFLTSGGLKAESDANSRRLPLWKNNEFGIRTNIQRILACLRDATLLRGQNYFYFLHDDKYIRWEMRNTKIKYNVFIGLEIFRVTLNPVLEST